MAFGLRVPGKKAASTRTPDKRCCQWYRARYKWLTVLDRQVARSDRHEVVHVGVLEAKLGGNQLLGVDRLFVLVKVGEVLICFLAPLTSKNMLLRLGSNPDMFFLRIRMLVESWFSIFLEKKWFVDFICIFKPWIPNALKNFSIFFWLLKNYCSKMNKWKGKKFPVSPESGFKILLKFVQNAHLYWD